MNQQYTQYTTNTQAIHNEISYNHGETTQNMGNTQIHTIHIKKW